MFHNKQALIGLYSGSTPTGARLTGLYIDTLTPSTILIDWGDGTSQTMNSNTSVSHTFYCPDYSAPSGWWNDINTCL